MAVGAMTSVSFLAAGSAFAAGFEKTIQWGGRQAGVAGIAVPYVQGADALFFNPAGLVSDRVGQEMSLNVSPTNSQAKAPINNSNTLIESNAVTSTPFGLIYGATLDENIGFGIGGFSSAGTRADYGNVDFAGNGTPGPELKSDIRVTEISAGVGYKVAEDLKLGLALRYVQTEADISLANRTALGFPGGEIANVKLTGLKHTETLAFRLGAQYRLSESTELGLAFRSEVNIEAKGRSTRAGFTQAGNANFAALTQAENDATVYTTLPMQLNLGGLHKIDEDWTVMAEYGWTQYSRVGDIRVTGPAVSGQSNIQTGWWDQHVLRLGGEFGGLAAPIRFGYAYTSQVVPGERALPTLSPPGAGHSLTVGSGYDFKIGEQTLSLNGAFEYSTVSGDSNGTAAGTTGVGTDTRAGTFSGRAMAAHLGVSYLF